MSTRPIRLFGDPVLRTPADPVVDFDKELRTLVQDLTDTMLEAPGSGLAAPQIGVGLRVFTWHVDGELGHLVNPPLTLSEEIQDGPEGCLSIPGFTIDCKRALSVVAHGFDMYGEPVLVEGSEMLARAIQHETDHLDGILFVDRLDREARKEAMKFIREAEWFGDPAPQVKVSPARHPRSRALTGPCASSSPAPPRPPCPSLEAVAASRHELVGVVTRPTRPRVAAAGWSPRPSPQRAEELGVPVLKPDHPRDPDFQDALRALDAGLLPGRRLRRAAAAVGARHPRARLGQPALLGAARLARRRAGAARDLGRRRGHRRDHLPDRARRSTPVRRSALMTQTIRPDDTAGDLLARLAEGGAGLLVQTLDGIEDGSLEAREQPEDGVSFAPKITVEDAHVDWSEPAIARRPPGPGLHARPRGLDDVRRRADQARPGAAGRVASGWSRVCSR